MSNLGSRLKKARLYKKFTQRMVASKVGVSIGTISGYERSYREPDSQILMKLADLYQVSLDWLYGRVVKTAESCSISFLISEAEEKYQVRLMDDPLVVSAVSDLIRNLAKMKKAGLRRE